jgi:hypothetical protein
MSALEGTGGMPELVGPPAPALESEDDPMSWHDIPALPAHGMRRRRRIDVWLEDGTGVVECFFRDSHMSPDGLETVVHEYTVHATVDVATGRFLHADADVGALPWPECPLAAPSATRLDGVPVDGIRRLVRETFVGTTTCTHLNDTLRSMQDVGALLSQLA